MRDEGSHWVAEREAAAAAAAAEEEEEEDEEEEEEEGGKKEKCEAEKSAPFVPIAPTPPTFPRTRRHPPNESVPLPTAKTWQR